MNKLQQDIKKPSNQDMYFFYIYLILHLRHIAKHPGLKKSKKKVKIVKLLSWWVEKLITCRQMSRLAQTHLL